MTLHSSRLTIFKIMAQRWKAIMERLVAATASPGQDRRVVILILITYTTVWTAYAIIAKSTQGIHPDMAEVFSWSWDLDWGTHKHPPLLPALVSLWFSVFPVSDWAYYLLAVISAAVAIYFTWLLSGFWLQGAKRAAVYGVPEEDLGQYYAQRTLLKREVLPENIANAAFALCTSDFSHTTGLHIPVDAGVAAAFLR